MAEVILGGLFTSTILNMIVVPVLYMKYGWERNEAFARQLAIERGEILDVTEESNGRHAQSSHRPTNQK